MQKPNSVIEQNKFLKFYYAVKDRKAELKKQIKKNRKVAFKRTLIGQGSTKGVCHG